MDNGLAGPLHLATLKAGAVHTTDQTAELFLVQTLMLDHLTAWNQGHCQHVNTGGMCVLPCCCRQSGATVGNYRGCTWA